MLDIDELESGFGKVEIGILSQEIIDLLGIGINPCKIVMWEDRFNYIHKHIVDFKSAESFRSCIAKIPEIIANPDYVAKHPTKNSIEFIKRVDELMIIAVRIRPHGELALRTAFPLSEDQLKDYIQKGTAIKYR